MINATIAKQNLLAKMAQYGVFPLDESQITIQQTIGNLPVRFQTQGDERKKTRNEWAGFVFINVDYKKDEIYGAFGDHRSSEQVPFSVSYLAHTDELSNFIRPEKTQEELDAIREELEKKRIAEQEQKAKREAMVRDVFDKNSIAIKDGSTLSAHEYFSQKKISFPDTTNTIKGIVVRSAETGSYLKDEVSGKRIERIADTIFIPRFDVETGNLISYQRIFKGYDAHERKVGMRKGYIGANEGVFIVGDIGDTRTPAVIVEGLSTGLSVHEATGFTVIVAFDAGGLPKVARQIRKKHPNQILFVGVDNDEKGISKAEEAFKVSGAECIHTGSDKAGYDFNDLMCDEGKEAVQRRFDKAWKRLGGVGFFADTVEPVSSSVVPVPPESVPVAHEEGCSCCVTGVEYAVSPQSPNWIEGYNRSGLVNTDIKGNPNNDMNAFEEITKGRLGINFRRNLMTNADEIYLPHECRFPKAKINMKRKFEILKGLLSNFKFNLGSFERKVSASCSSDSYHPVKEWILSKEWDGVSRFDAFFNSITLTRPERADVYKEVLRKWLLGGVASWCSDEGMPAEIVFILTGAGNIGKSQWFASILPETINGDTTFGDGEHAGDVDTRDGVTRILSKAIVEFAEIDATTRNRLKADQLKRFITQKTNTFRMAYDIANTELHRHTLFGGTANTAQLFSDLTGNRKYAVVEVQAIDANHGVDMQQLLRELHDTEFLKWVDLPETSGKKFLKPWLIGQKVISQLIEYNKGGEINDPAIDALNSVFDFSTNKDTWTHWMTTRDALLLAEFNNPTRADSAQVNDYLNRTEVLRTKRNGYWGWFFPKPNKPQNPNDGGHNKHDFDDTSCDTTKHEEKHNTEISSIATNSLDEPQKEKKKKAETKRGADAYGVYTKAPAEQRSVSIGISAKTETPQLATPQLATSTQINDASGSSNTHKKGGIEDAIDRFLSRSQESNIPNTGEFDPDIPF